MEQTTCRNEQTSRTSGVNKAYVRRLKPRRLVHIGTVSRIDITTCPNPEHLSPVLPDGWIHLISTSRLGGHLADSSQRYTGAASTRRVNRDRHCFRVNRSFHGWAEIDHNHLRLARRQRS